MTCSGNENLINQYLDGELSPPEAERFEAHLAGCQACQHELAQTRTLFTLLSQVQEAPVSLRQEVLAGLPRQQASPLGRWVLLAQGIATLVLLALALPTLQAWYEQASAWLAPGWLSHLLADAGVWWQGSRLWLASVLTIEVRPTLPQGLGLAWPQAAVIAVALVGLWVLGNRLLFNEKPNGTGGMR